VAVAFGCVGANVLVNFITDGRAVETVVEKIRGIGSHTLAYKADVSDEAQIAANMLLQLARQEFGTLDILVANAGVQEDAPVGDMTLAQWNKVLSVSLTGQFLCARAAIQEFSHRGLRPDVSCALGKII
jgi:glucose 1-dehydrogenase